MRARGLRTATVVLLMSVGACGITTPDIDSQGIVRYVDVEGGCWGIESDGTMYEPTNLPESMRIAGLVVAFEAEELTDGASICQIGPIIRLLRITTPAD